MAYNRGPTPSRHNHAGMMEWTPEENPRRGRCGGCGQEWRVSERKDKLGNLLWSWVPMIDGSGSDPGGAW